ncbi:hypothetical protein D9M73_234630 [compost metagenome]
MFPALMTGLDVDVPGIAQQTRFGAPCLGQVQRPWHVHGRVVVRADNLARERQHLGRDRRKVAQHGCACGPFDICRRHQQCATHLPQQGWACLRCPMGDSDATKAVGNQDYRRAVGGNRLL